jgi:hypothetical protein
VERGADGVNHRQLADDVANLCDGLGPGGAFCGESGGSILRLVHGDRDPTVPVQT